MANWFPRRCSKSIPKLSSNGGSKTREKAQPSWPGWIAPTQFTEAKNETMANTACLHMVSLVLRAPFGGPQRKPNGNHAKWVPFADTLRLQCLPRVSAAALSVTEASRSSNSLHRRLPTTVSAWKAMKCFAHCISPQPQSSPSAS